MLYTHLCSKCNTIAAILTALDWVRTDGLLGWWVGWFGVESFVFLLLYKFTGRFLFVSISQFNLFTFNTRTILERSLTHKKFSKSIHRKKWRYKFGTQIHLFQVDSFWSNIQLHLTRMLVNEPDWKAVKRFYHIISFHLSEVHLILHKKKSSNPFKVQQINPMFCNNWTHKEIFAIDFPVSHPEVQRWSWL